jgi:glutathione peroxidase
VVIFNFLIFRAIVMSIYSFSVKTSDQQEKSLADYQGKVVLIVNTASQCGFTPQYKELQALYEKYGSEKFAVLAFPCNQFAGQEPGDNAEIANFCQLNYQVTFPVFAKVEVNGKNTAPLFAYLKAQCKGILGTETIKWNFTKFLVNPQGDVVKRYAPTTTPNSIAQDIESYL